MSKEEERVSGNLIYRGRILNLRVDNVRLPDGGKSMREVVEHAPAVGIVAEAGNGDLLLVRQFRYPAGESLLEIPAGIVEPGESALETAMRELQEETGISGVALFQVHTYGALNRDPRHRTISIAYAGMLSDAGAQAKAGDDAAVAEWHPVGQLPPLAFDHDKIVEDAIAFARERGWF